MRRILSKVIRRQAQPMVVAPDARMPDLFSPDEIIGSLRYLTTRLSRENSLPKRLSIVSALRGEGVTYVARALGATIAHDLGKSVCIVDLNWWFPSTSPWANQQNEGIAGAVAGITNVTDILVYTGLSDLYWAPPGEVTESNRPVLARSQALKGVINELGNTFDHLILDIPAISATVDAIPLASLGNACCLVVHQGATWKEDVQLALDEIDHLSILGVVMNKVQLATPSLFVKLIGAR